jgi:hypothetical protein
MKSLNSSPIIISFLVSQILLFTFLLYRDINQKIEAGNRVVIGKIRFKEKVAQRKFDDRVVWADINQNEDVTNKDTIRTTSESSAIITLNNGMEIELEENSMILLDFSDKSVNVNFAYGSIATKSNNAKGANQDITIKSGEKSIDLKNGEIKLSLSDQKDLQLTVEKGEATLKTKDEEKSITQDQLVSISSESSSIKIESVPTKLLSPSNQKIITLSPENPSVFFEWQINNDTKEKVLEIAKNYSFTSNIKKYPVKENNLSLNLEEGIYYWRLSYKNNKGNIEKSEPFKFNIVYYRDLAILSPTPNKLFEYTKQTPLISFKWTPINYVNYILELSNDRDFKNITRKINSITNSISIDDLQAGIYFYRVITVPQLEGLEPNKSSISQFEIIQRKQLIPPEIYTLNDSFYSQLLQSGKYILSWKDSIDFNQYEIEISSDNKFSNIITKSKISENYYTIKSKYEKGKYFWRVKGITKDKEQSKESSIASFSILELETEIKQISPQNNIEYNQPNNVSINFEWTKLKFDALYQLEISEDEKFNKVIRSFKSNSNTRTVDLDIEGVFFWRIKATTQEGTEISSSKNSKFSITKPIGEMSFKFPINGQVVDMSGKENLTFQWEQIPKIQKYHFELYLRSGKINNLILKEESKSTSYIIKELNILDEGKFQAKLWGEYNSPDGKIKSTNPIICDFSLELSKKIQPPKIKTKKNIYVK